MTKLSARELTSAIARLADATGENPVVSDTGSAVDMTRTAEHRAMDVKRKSKFNAQPVTVDNVVFASKAESRRHLQLQLLENAGMISELELQPKFVLQESFRDAQGRQHRAITFTADYSYLQDRQRVVEDVKGGKATQTQQFAIRWKWVIKLNPFIRFEIIGEEK